MASETSLCRDRLSKYCVGNGIDVGFGGDPIVITAITVDLARPYVRVGHSPQNLICDIRDLITIFRKKSLDYIYSSHLLEDFQMEEMNLIFWRLVSLIKIGGRIILYLPDQQKYLEYCKKEKSTPNPLHKIHDFSLERFKNIVMLEFPYSYKCRLEIEHENHHVEDYSFEIVIKKVAIERKNV